MALTYEGADAVFNVSSYSGALLLQAGARKADGGLATTKRGAARGRGCIMHTRPHIITASRGSFMTACTLGEY